MKWATRSIAIWALAAVAVLGVSWIVLRTFSAPKEVPAIQVDARPIERVLAAVGRVRAQETVSVFSRVPGQVVALSKREGDTVQAGDILGRLDDRQARAVLAQATASAESQRRRWTQLRRDLARTQTLLKKGYATRATAERDRSASDAAATDLKRLMSAIDEAQLRLRDYEIRAPMAGRVLIRPVDPGQVVDARTEIFQLGSSGPPDVECEIDETLAGKIRLGMPARLALARSPSTIVPGQVTFVAPRVDPATGGQTVRISFSANPGDVPSGQTVDVNIIVERRVAAIAIPRSAILTSGAQPTVAVVEGNQVTFREIAFQDWPASSVIVTQGLSARDVVVLDPAKVAEGQTIRPKLTEAPE